MDPTREQEQQQEPQGERKRRRPRWPRIVGLIAMVIVLLLAGTGVALTLVTNSFVSSGRIAKNVFVEDVRVAGMTVAEAVEALHREWEPRLPKELELTYPGGNLKIPQKDLGAKLRFDRAAADAHRMGREGGLVERIGAQIRLRRKRVHIEVDCVVNEQALDAALADVAGKVNKQPMNAEVEVGDDDEVRIKAHVTGLVVNLEQSKAALLAALKKPGSRGVELVVDEQQPDITSQDLAHLETVLASYTTKFSPGQVNRSHNLRLATKALNKTVVMPGDVFSVNDIVGERLPERDYRKAPIFWTGGELRDDYGGGLCQVASTMFNTALRANMSIVERSPHNRRVTYVPLGLDAMVNYGSIDLRWRNTLDNPVLVLASVHGDAMTYKIIGKKSDKAEVKIERSNVGTIGPPDKEIKDPELEDGKRVKEKSGWSGGYANAWRLTKVNGEWQKTWAASSRYPPGPNVYRVGTKKKPEAEPEPGGEPVPRIPRVPDEDSGASSTSEGSTPPSG